MTARFLIPKKCYKIIFKFKDKDHICYFKFKKAHFDRKKRFYYIYYYSCIIYTDNNDYFDDYYADISVNHYFTLQSTSTISSVKEKEHYREIRKYNEFFTSHDEIE
jgi:hypothetical protein